jgi:AcrR family transcriptional regulator
MDADLLRRSDGWGVGQGVSPISSPPTLKTREPWRNPPRQARSVAARRQLLDAGRQLFAEKGFEAASVAEISAKAGTAVGAFYLYFRSKRQLLVALMNELLARLAQVNLRPEGGTDVQHGLRNFLAAVFRVDLDYFGVVRAWQEASLTDAELGKMQGAIQSWTEGRISGVFQLLQSFPGARSDCDLPTFARMMDRHFWSLLARASGIPRKEFDREIKTSADVIYHYLFCDPE